MSAPPPYHYNATSALTTSQRPSAARIAAQDAYWDEKRPKDWFSGAYNLEMGFEPQKDTAGKEGSSSEISGGWTARMQVRAKNIPRLMRDGFHWSSENVLGEQGFVILNIAGRRDGIKHLRVYFLKDLSPNEEWFARINVATKDEASLAKFELSWLSVSQIQSAEARNWD